MIPDKDESKEIRKQKPKKTKETADHSNEGPGFRVPGKSLKTEERRLKMPKITLKAARVNAGLTQDDIAGHLGVSRSIVNEWENGKRSMRPAYLLAYCQITGFDPEDIFFIPKGSTISGLKGDKK